MKHLRLSILLLTFGIVFAQHATVLVDQVMPGSAAEQAGLQPGDQIVALEGKTIGAMPDLQAVLDAHQPGDTVPIKIARGGETLEMDLTFGERPGGGVSIGVMLNIGMGHGVDAQKKIDAEQRAAALRAAAKALKEGYVFAAKGKAMARELVAAAKEDRFSEATTLASFVSLVNPLLAEIGNDKHLRIGLGRPRFEGDAGHGPTMEAPDQGVREARKLEDGIGYLDLSMFAGGDAAKKKIDEAMLSLADSTALIIDLRRNGGGEGWMVGYLSGFLFPEKTHLTNRMSRSMKTPQEHWTRDGQPTQAFSDTPVFLLTSRGTFSAAEAFTFGLNIKGRATIVGERTGGGGHFGDDVALGSDLRMFLPMGRTYDPKTGEGWEAEGIAPDIEVPQDQALERAIDEARGTIVDGST